MRDVVVLVAMIIVGCASYAAGRGLKQESYDDGYEEGHSKGYSEGFDEAVHEQQENDNI